MRIEWVPRIYLMFWLLSIERLQPFRMQSLPACSPELADQELILFWLWGC